MEFNLGALMPNYRTLRAQIGPEPHIIPALKGNAYGHGVGPIARCLAEFDVHSLSTGSLQDALAIREAGIDLSNFDHAHVGDEVTLLGKSGENEITIEELAGWHGKVPYQLLMALNERMPCHYIDAAT